MLSLCLMSLARAGIIISCFELLMIQQQNFGGSLLGTLRSLTATHGGMGVLMRAAPMASGREACFAASYVGAVPIAQRYLSSQHGMNPTAAALVGECLGARLFCVWCLCTENAWKFCIYVI